MNRRDALKNLTKGLGYAIAAPTIMNILSACTAETNTWKPLFLSDAEKHIVTHLVDIIIPKSDTPGALDVNIPQFIDTIYHEIETDSNKSIFKEGAKLFSKKFTSTYNKESLNGKKEDFETLLTSYFNLSEKETKTLFRNQRKSIEDITKKDLDSYYTYKFLLSIRYYSIFGYVTSEKIGEEVLAYDPIPGTYKGDISVTEATNGRAWSL